MIRRPRAVQLLGSWARTSMNQPCRSDKITPPTSKIVVPDCGISAAPVSSSMWFRAIELSLLSCQTPPRQGRLHEARRLYRWCQQDNREMADLLAGVNRSIGADWWRWAMLAGLCRGMQRGAEASALSGCPGDTLRVT